MDKHENPEASVRTAARWPYALGVGSAVLGAAGLVYAPFSMIVYPLALPGVCVSAVWAVVRRSPMRVPLTAASSLLAIGIVLASLAMFPFLTDWAAIGVIGRVVVQETAFVFFLVLPALALAVAIPAAATALRRTGVGS